MSPPPSFHKIQFIPAATASKHLKPSLQQQNSSHKPSLQQQTHFECGRFLPSRFHSHLAQFQLSEQDFLHCIGGANRMLFEFQRSMNRLDEAYPENSKNGKLWLVLAFVSSLPSCGLSLLLYHLWPKLKKRKRLQKIQELRMLCKQKLEQWIEEENETLAEKEIRLELVFGPVQYPILNNEEEEEEEEQQEPSSVMPRTHSQSSGNAWDGIADADTTSNDGDAADFHNSYEDPFTTVHGKHMDHSLEDQDEKLKNQQDDYNDGSYILKRNTKNELTKSQLLKGFIKSPRKHHHLSSQDTTKSNTTSTAPEIGTNISVTSSNGVSSHSKLPNIEIFEENQVPHIRFISNNRKSVYLMDYYRTAQRDSSTLNSPTLLFKRNFSDVEELSGSLSGDGNNLFPSELKGVQFEYTNFHPLNPYRKI
nr:unnamed protein product [Naegleria fowleri]